MDDAALLESFAVRGDEKAFAELVRRHMGFVYSVALRRVGGDVHLAQDVSQEVFVAMGRKAKRLTGHPALKAWLYTAVRFKAANHMQIEQRRRTRENIHAMEISDRPDPSPVAWDRLRPLLDEALDHLNERDRTAVILRFFEQRSFGAIGHVQGLSEDGARQRINRALAKLATAIERRGITSTAAGLALGLSSETMAAVAPGLVDAATRSALSILQASAPAAASSAGLLTTVSSTKVGLGVAAAIVLLAAVGWREWNLVAERGRTLESLQQQVDRDRDEIWDLSRQRSQAQAVARGTAVVADEADILTKRVSILRAWFTRYREFAIPELHLLAGRDWVAFAYEHPEIDAGGDLWPVGRLLRIEAMAAGKTIIQTALQNYVASSEGRPLTDSSLLLPYGPSLDAAILEHYWAFPDVRAIKRFATSPPGPALVSRPQLDSLPVNSADPGSESWQVITEHSMSNSSRMIGDRRPISAWP